MDFCFLTVIRKVEQCRDKCNKHVGKHSSLRSRKQCTRNSNAKPKRGKKERNTKCMHYRVEQQMTGYVPNSFGQLTRVVCVHTHEGTSRRGNERTRERVALFGRDKRPLESDVCSQ